MSRLRRNGSDVAGRGLGREGSGRLEEDLMREMGCIRKGRLTGVGGLSSRGGGRGGVRFLISSGRSRGHKG